MKQGWEYKKLDFCAYIEYGTRVVQKKDGGTIYPVYGGGGETFRIDRFNREDCLIVARFAMSPLCVRYVRGKFFLNDSGLSVKAGKELYQSYLNHHIKSLNDKIYNLGKGAAQRNLDVKSFKNLQIGIPPKSTQLAIVSELDKINELIRLKKEQLKDFDNLAQSIFYEMFGDPVENEMGFDTKRLDEVFPLITDGTHQTPTYTEDRENGYKFLSAKDVTSGSINWNNVKFIPAWLHDNLSKRLKPQKNDILLCKNGTTGICALVENDETFDIYVSLALLRPSNMHNPKYLTYAINNPATKRQFDDSLKGIGVPNLHLKEIRKTIIILPPLPLQNLFAQRIEQIEHQKSEVQNAITDLETLLASRMQYWFE